MKKIIAMLTALMMLAGLLPLVYAESAEEVSVVEEEYAAPAEERAETAAPVPVKEAEPKKEDRPAEAAEQPQKEEAGQKDEPVNTDGMQVIISEEPEQEPSVPAEKDETPAQESEQEHPVPAEEPAAPVDESGDGEDGQPTGEAEAPAEQADVPEEKPAEQSAELSVVVKADFGTGSVLLGSKATLRVEVSGADDYDVSWETRDLSWRRSDKPEEAEKAWTRVSTAKRFTFTVSESDASLEFRAVINGGQAVSAAYTLPSIIREDKTAEPAEETEEPAEPAEETEEPAEAIEETEEPAETAEETEEPAEPAEKTEESAEPAGNTEEPAEQADGTEEPAEPANDSEETEEPAEQPEEGSEEDVEGTDENESDGDSEENPEENPEEILEEEEEPVEKKVAIFSDRRDVMNEGETVTLTSQIEGFDGYEIVYQWECDKNDGQGFQPVEGANSDTYSFEATAENLRWHWRLMVYYR